MFTEHDRVVLTADLAETALKAGDVGTVVHVYPNAAAFEVEFLALDGNTAALATVLPSPGTSARSHRHHPCQGDPDHRLKGNDSLWSLSGEYR